MQSLKLKITKSLAVSMLTVLITGCSGEPSNDDVDKSIRASTDDAIKQLEKAGVMDPQLKPTINEVRKIGCAEARGEAGFICDVESDITTPATGRIKGVEKFRIVNNDGTWVVIEKIK